MKDRRARLHIAGAKPTITHNQICTRCYVVMAKRGTDGWKEGAVVASKHGNWSVLGPEDAIDGRIHRPCGKRGPDDSFDLWLGGM